MKFVIEGAIILEQLIVWAAFCALHSACIASNENMKKMQIGFPAGMQGVVFSLSNVLIQSSINSFGSIAMAGNTASMNIKNFIYISMNTFQQTAMSFTSQNYGAGEEKRIHRSHWMLYISYPITWIITGDVHILCYILVRKKQLQAAGNR